LTSQKIIFDLHYLHNSSKIELLSSKSK
jgi:hypothetical protein